MKPLGRHVFEGEDVGARFTGAWWVACVGALTMACGGPAPSPSAAPPAPPALPPTSALVAPTIADAPLHAADAATAPPSVAPPSAEPDLVIAVPPGDARRTIAFPIDEPTCTFDRAELALEIESMPDGHVTLALAGATDRRSLRVLTTTHFVHTWDWAHLPGLRAARGTPIGTEVRLELALRGAVYCGGSCEGGAAPMDAPRIVSGEIRVWCAQPAPISSEALIRAEGSTESGHPRAVGQDAVARFRVGSRCTVDEAHVEVRGAARWDTDFVLVTPEGLVRPVARWVVQGEPGARKSVASIPRAHGLASDGVWELRAIRGGPDVDLEGASITIDCAL